MSIFATIALIIVGIIIGGLLYIIFCLVLNEMLLGKMFPLEWRYIINKRRFDDKDNPIFKLVHCDKIYRIEKWEVKEEEYDGNLIAFTPFGWFLSQYTYKRTETSKMQYTLEEVNKMDSLANEWERNNVRSQKRKAKEDEQNYHINLLNKKFEENYE